MSEQTRGSEPPRQPLHEKRLTEILEMARLPTPPAVAMRIVQATAGADCSAAEISEMLRQDPAICAQVLKAINSCVYGLSTPVSSVERAVILLGLNTVRSIVLTLSLPAMQFEGVPDAVLREHWLSSVSGAIIARELSVRMRQPLAEDDLLCGLMRNLGELVLRMRFPTEHERFTAGMVNRPFSDFCKYEREVFGVDHAEVSAELLRRWRLPPAITEPIRYHHEPHRMVDAPQAFIDRAERLSFVVALTNLDLVAHNPAEVDALLKLASARYSLSQTDLIEFLQSIVPKIDAFTEILSIDIGRCPDYASTLAHGCSELVKLAVQSGRVTMAAPPSANPHAHLAPTLRPIPDPTDFEFSCSGDHSELLTWRAAGEYELEPTVGGTLDGFELKAELGRGAMGVVYKAYESTLQRFVALKVMSPQLSGDPQHRQRFVREARSVAAVHHENVVSIFGVWDRPSFSYLAMEFVDGETLGDVIEREHPMPFERLRDIAVQIAAGLTAAHACQIVHRDVKPSNVLLDRKTGRVKLTDFGLAKAAHDPRITAVGTVVGTPLYMSPEQAEGRPEDARSDLFSLGSVFYTMAAGQPPFDGPSIPVVLQKVCMENPIVLKLLRPDLPEGFRAVVRKLLAKRPEDRFPTGESVVTALKQIEVNTNRKPATWRNWFGR